MKHLVSMAIFAMVCAGFFACSNFDDGNTIIIKIPNGSQYSAFIDSVSYGNKDVGFRKVPYNNGNLVLNMKDIDMKNRKIGLLEPIQQKFGVKNMIISDPNTQCFSYWEPLYTGAYKNKYVGSIKVSNIGGKNGNDYEKVYPCLWYVDRDCQISGSGSHEGFSFTYNLSLKKGWNVIYGFGGYGKDGCANTPPNGWEWTVHLD